MDAKLLRAKITLKNRMVLFIQFNDFSEYVYQIKFSEQELDRIRFDNYDKMWKNETQPHHYHPKRKKEGISSPMNGDVKHDIPIFIELILKEIHDDFG